MAVDKQIGQYLEGKSGEKDARYIKIDQDVTLKKGDILKLEAPDAKYMRMINSGKFPEEKVAQFEQEMEKIPAFVVARLVLKPSK